MSRTLTEPVDVGGYKLPAGVWLIYQTHASHAHTYTRAYTPSPGTITLPVAFVSRTLTEAVDMPAGVWLIYHTHASQHTRTHTRTHIHAHTYTHASQCLNRYGDMIIIHTHMLAHGLISYGDKIIIHTYTRTHTYTHIHTYTHHIHATRRNSRLHVCTRTYTHPARADECAHYYPLPRIYFLPHFCACSHSKNFFFQTMVSVSPYVIHHSPSIWRDPEAFLPER